MASGVTVVDNRDFFEIAHGRRLKIQILHAIASCAIRKYSSKALMKSKLMLDVVDGRYYIGMTGKAEYDRFFCSIRSSVPAYKICPVR